MAPDVVDRAFEPFFTMKPVGKGSGLGLSQVYGFARQSGGTAIIESVEGAGTSVSIFLPRADSREPQSVETTPSEPGALTQPI
jgi:signal transduction histidine kinase